jgi:hypothetical protein
MPKQKATKTKKTTKARAKTQPRPSKSKPPVAPHHQTEIEDQALAGDTILTPDDTQPLLSTGKGDTWDYQADPQVTEILAEEQNTETGGDELAEELRAHNSLSPILSGGDVDADWQRTDSVGEESVGGTVPTPDQDRVDELGQAVGLTYQDEEPLDFNKKMGKRERDRWELDPASENRPK